MVYVINAKVSDEGFSRAFFYYQTEGFGFYGREGPLATVVHLPFTWTSTR